MAYKEGLVENSETTYARLKVELEQRQADLEKINNLDVKISKEMKTVTEKLEQMEDEMNNKFTGVDQLRKNFENEKQRMGSLRGKLQTLNPGINKQV